MKKQAGNVIELVIIGIVLIGAVALIAWRYIEADEDQNAAEQAATNSEIAPQSNKKANIKLSDWGVEIKQNGKFGTLATTPYETTDNNIVMITSSKLAEGTFTCEEGKDHKNLLGRVERRDAQDDTHTVKVGDKYYGFFSAMAKECYGESELNTLGQEFGKDFKSLLVVPQE